MSGVRPFILVRNGFCDAGDDALCAARVIHGFHRFYLAAGTTGVAFTAFIPPSTSMTTTEAVLNDYEFHRQ